MVIILKNAGKDIGDPATALAKNPRLQKLVKDGKMTVQEAHRMVALVARLKELVIAGRLSREEATDLYESVFSSRGLSVCIGFTRGSWHCSLIRTINLSPICICA